MAAATSVLALTVTGCSQGDSSADAGSAGSGIDTAGSVPADAPADGIIDGRNPGALPGPPAIPPDEANVDVEQIGIEGASLIKTAAVTLESEDVYDVLTGIRDLAVTAGGQISSEETGTNRDGEGVRSRIELQVPVARFDWAYERVAELGTLVSRTRAVEDVTGQVADVDSRVASAEDSIAQLQRLFAHATKLGQIITLEGELSRREADLEALQAQQRTLGAQTTMSTISINISEPKADETTTSDKPEKRGGFVSGIKKGWDGLVTFVVASSHGLGLVLPLGTLALLGALVARILVRRFMPRLHAPPQP